MPKQEVRLTVCRTDEEVAVAREHDRALGFEFVRESRAVETDVGIEVNIPVDGDIEELFVRIPANLTSTPPPPTVTPPLRLVICKRVNS